MTYKSPASVFSVPLLYKDSGLYQLPPSLLRRLYDSRSVSLEGLLKVLSKASMGRRQPQGQGVSGGILIRWAWKIPLGGREVGWLNELVRILIWASSPLSLSNIHSSFTHLLLISQILRNHPFPRNVSILFSFSKSVDCLPRAPQTWGPEGILAGPVSAGVDNMPATISQ